MFRDVRAVVGSEFPLPGSIGGVSPLPIALLAAFQAEAGAHVVRARTTPVARAASYTASPLVLPPVQPTVTAELAAHFLRASTEFPVGDTVRELLATLGERMALCVRYRYRCGCWCCPRCQVRNAVRYRKKIERHLRRCVESGSLLGHLTVTVPVDDVAYGFRTLGECISELRESAAWAFSGIVGGVIHLEVVPCGPASARSFLVHAHVIVEVGMPDHDRHSGSAADWTPMLFGLLPFDGSIVSDALAFAWTVALGRRHLRGDLLLEHRDPWWEPDERHGTRSRLAMYVSKRCRSELLAYAPEQLAHMAVFYMTGRRRFARGMFGSWHPATAGVAR